MDEKLVNEVTQDNASKDGDKVNTSNGIVTNQKNNSNGRKNKKIIIAVVGIIIIIAIIGLAISGLDKGSSKGKKSNKISIPEKYRGTYMYIGVNFSLTEINISEYSIVQTDKFIGDSMQREKKYEFEYYLKGEDLIIKKPGKKDTYDNYVILEDDKLYISDSKKTKPLILYWNTESKNADIYYFDAYAWQIMSKTDSVFNDWARQRIFDDNKTKPNEDKEYNVFTTKSDEEPDITDLNKYEIKYDIENTRNYSTQEPKGLIKLIFDKKEKKLTYANVYYPEMWAEESDDGNITNSYESYFDAEGYFLALMYTLGTDDTTLLLGKNTEYKNKIVKDYDAYRDSDNVGFIGDNCSYENERYSLYGIFERDKLIFGNETGYSASITMK